MLAIIFRPDPAPKEDNRDQYLMTIPSVGTPADLMKQVWTTDFRLAKIFTDPVLARMAYDKIRCSSQLCKNCKKCIHTGDKTKIPPPVRGGTITVARIEMSDAVAAFRI